MSVELSLRFTFDAAHRFEHFPDGHANARVHGHSFSAEVSVRGEPDARTGFLVEFGELERACAEVRAELDHRLLNEVPGLGAPSLENLCAWIWRRLAPRLPVLSAVRVSRESAGQSCVYTGPRSA
ncbi:MAG TPA: 6-carboxytetrahydropterin synthase [Burkholderiales bacterium]